MISLLPMAFILLAACFRTRGRGWRESMLCGALAWGAATTVVTEILSPPAARRGVLKEIRNAADLTCEAVVGQRVLCPAGFDHVFKSWPLGWDEHAKVRSGVAGDSGEERKRAFKGRFQHLIC